MSGCASWRPRLAVLGLVALGLVLVGCSASPDPRPAAAPPTSQPNSGPQSASPPDSAAAPVTLISNVHTANSGVPVDTAVTVRASGGALKMVVLRDGAGKALVGRFNANKTRWTASEFLDPGVRYTLMSRAVNVDGKLTRSTRAFTSQRLTLDQQTYPSVTPLGGSVMGIGMPVIVTFDVPVTDRAEMQKYMSIRSTPAQVGSWHWVSSQEVHWRPRTYWRPGTNVHVNLRLNGVNAGKGIYGQLDRNVDFRIGRSVLIKANVRTDHMQVYVDGKLARTIPITGGKPGSETRSAINLISEKFLSKRMNSATVGIDPNSPDGYNIADVRFPMRITDSGEFLHAAPWSVYAQGHYNVSHGCIGMSTANARWLYGLAEVGTPVVVTGNSRPLEPGNGWTDWNQTWAQYRTSSAIK